MTRYFRNTLIVLALTAHTMVSHAANVPKIDLSRCEAVLSNEAIDRNDLDALWRHSPGSTIMSLRAAAPHYWAWVRLFLKAVQNLDERIQLIFTQKGVIAADLHHWNLADIWVGREGAMSSRYFVDDHEDGGIGDVFFDFVHFYARTVLIAPSISQKQKKGLVQAYVDGLLGKKYDKPDFIQDALDVSEKRFWKEHDKMIDQLTKGNRLHRYGDKRLMNIADAAFGKRFQVIENQFAQLLESGNYRILDIALRIKSDGGSQGNPVFWYLVNDQLSRRNKIFEYKQLPIAPASAQAEVQPDQGTRLDKVFDVYWSEKFRSQASHLQYRHLQALDGYHYLLRPRFPKLVDIPKTAQDREGRKKFMAASLYNANHIGRRHGKQDSMESYIDTIDDIGSEFFDLVDTTSQSYMQLTTETQNEFDAQK